MGEVWVSKAAPHLNALSGSPVRIWAIILVDNHPDSHVENSRSRLVGELPPLWLTQPGEPQVRHG